jgi:uncharacterized protein (TIGR02217 family)
MSIPYISQALHNGPNLGLSGPTLSMNVAQGDWVFAIGMGRPDGLGPILNTTGASSDWITLLSSATQIYAYRQATADEIDMSVTLYFPGGVPFEFDAELYLIVVKGAVRVDGNSATDMVHFNVSVTTDGITMASRPGFTNIGALWVMYSQDGYPFLLGALEGEIPLVVRNAFPAGFGLAFPGSYSFQLLVLSGARPIVEFPRTLEFKSTAGDSFLTLIDKGGGGGESRRSSRDLTRKKWLVGLKTPASFKGNQQKFVDLLMAFFLNSAGKAYSFRVRDPVDFRAIHEAPVHLHDDFYQLVKRYQIGGRTYVRNIYKPITEAVTDWQGNILANTVHQFNPDGSPLPDSSFNLDPETGIVQTDSGFGAPLFDFEFDFPARFDSDELALQVHESFVSGGNIIAGVSSLPLIEVLPPEF